MLAPSGSPAILWALSKDDPKRERVRRQQLKQQLADIEDEIKALSSRLEALKVLTSLIGPGVASAVRADLDTLKRDFEELETRRKLANERLRTHRREDEPGLVGWLARRHWAWGIPLGLIVPTAAMLWLVDASVADHVDLRFFEAAAQVLPVLLLTVALEGRVLRASHLPPFLRTHYAVFLLIMAAGEAASLQALATGRASAIAFGLAGASLVVALQTMIVVVGQAAVD